MIHEGNTPKSINGSIDWVIGNIYAKPPKSDAELAQKGGDYIDVRDVANITSNILATEEASNERYIVVAGNVD
jgi:hypothetical protein